MDCNGFHSDNYRYFYLDKSQDWSGLSFTYDELKENDVIKLSKEDLRYRLFSSNYKLRVVDNIYSHHVKEFPINESFDLFKYICMQDPITFKWDGVVSFIYDSGEYAFINNWMKQKMNSKLKSRRARSDGSIKEENNRILNMIREEEIIQRAEQIPQIDDLSTKEISVVDEKEGLQRLQNRILRFGEDTKFELEYHKDETWSLTDSSLFLAVFNQNFIRLLANSVEILGEEKEKLFLQEYQDNIPGLSRRYYEVRQGVSVENISELMSECSFNDLGVGYDSLIVGINTEMVDTCELNRENFRSDGTIQYFYVDFMDGFNDRIAEKEILKVAVRLPQKEAMIRYKSDLEVIREKELEKEATEYIRKHQSEYRKSRRRNNMSMVEFVEEEKKKLQKRLVKSLDNRLQSLNIE